MRLRISIRGRVPPSVGPSVGPLDGPMLFQNDEKRHFWSSDDIKIQHRLKISEKESFEDTKCKKNDKNNTRKKIYDNIGNYHPNDVKQWKPKFKMLN